VREHAVPLFHVVLDHLDRRAQLYPIELLALFASQRSIESALAGKIVTHTGHCTGVFLPPLLDHALLLDDRGSLEQLLLEVEVLSFESKLEDHLGVPLQILHHSDLLLLFFLQVLDTSLHLHHLPFPQLLVLHQIAMRHCPVLRPFLLLWAVLLTSQGRLQQHRAGVFEQGLELQVLLLSDVMGTKLVGCRLEIHAGLDLRGTTRLSARLIFGSHVVMVTDLAWVVQLVHDPRGLLLNRLRSNSEADGV